MKSSVKQEQNAARLFYTGYGDEDEIVAAYERFANGTTTEHFVGMKSRKWDVNAVNGHLDDLQLSGWARGNARARLYEWLGIGGGLGAGGATGMVVKATPDEVVLSPEEVAVQETLKLLATEGSEKLEPGELSRLAAANAVSESGKYEHIECTSMYGRTLRSHGTGLHLIKAKSGEDPDSLTTGDNNTIKVSNSITKCVANAWTTEADYNACYVEMLYVVQSDGKVYIAKRLRALHEFVISLPVAQRLPYVKKIWKESVCGVPAVVNERALAVVQTAWADGLSSGKGEGGTFEVKELKKRLAALESKGNASSAPAAGAAGSWAEQRCFCCNGIGHRAIDCPEACKDCSTDTKAVRKGSPQCKCGAVGNE